MGDTVIDEQLEQRIAMLEKYVLDAKSEINIDSLLVKDFKEFFPLPKKIKTLVCCQDCLQALVVDCNHPNVRRTKNVDLFLQRCKLAILYLRQILNFCFSLPDEKLVELIINLRMKPDDFNVLKTIGKTRILFVKACGLIGILGRGSFGEVQLVRHKNTKKVYAMKVLSKFEMVSLRNLKSKFAKINPFCSCRSNVPIPRTSGKRNS